MSDERLSDELVANLAVWAADAKPTTREVEALAQEVKWWRSNGDWLEVLPIDALCARHDITVAGIVALVDEVFSEWGWTSNCVRLRRLAREEGKRINSGFTDAELRNRYVAREENQ